MHQEQQFTQSDIEFEWIRCSSGSVVSCMEKRMRKKMSFRADSISPLFAVFSNIELGVLFFILLLLLLYTTLDICETRDCEWMKEPLRQVLASADSAKAG
jgi:hypothetical protein